MVNSADLLIEIQTEELPAKSLESLRDALCHNVTKHLQQANLHFTSAKSYATPRRLAVFVEELALAQPVQTIAKKGPAIAVAYDSHGEPSAAHIGFARNCGVSLQDLSVLNTEQGSWLNYQCIVPGSPTITLLPKIIQNAIQDIPLAKPMRWGAGSYSFVRPITGLLVLLGNELVPVTICGVSSQSYTVGHRFHHHQAIKINNPSEYCALLRNPGKVIADCADRKAIIIDQANSVAREVLGQDKQVIFSPDLLDEVSGLVEWPVAVCGSFSADFLQLPAEVLIAVMQQHQRYFPIVDHAGNLQPHFIAILNIASANLEPIIVANNRVLHARLSDAAFFVHSDQQASLVSRVSSLEQISFQAKLGSLLNKTERLQKISLYLANLLKVDVNLIQRASLLAKADLTTSMVKEFPELQGIIGKYYAEKEQEDPSVALALAEQYYPRYAGDQLPSTTISCIVALADKLDSLVGLFGVNLIPSGEKDPYALRRSALGVIRIILEHKLSIELLSLLDYIFACYSELPNKFASSQVLNFIQERYKYFLYQQEVSSDIIAAVWPIGSTDFYDMYQRINALQLLKKNPTVLSLCKAHKRVRNIINKNSKLVSEDARFIPELLRDPAELELSRNIEQLTDDLRTTTDYAIMLEKLLALDPLISSFFQQVLVITEERAQCINRLVLLKQLDLLLSSVADLTCLTF